MPTLASVLFTIDSRLKTLGKGASSIQERGPPAWGTKVSSLDTQFYLACQAMELHKAGGMALQIEYVLAVDMPKQSWRAGLGRRDCIGPFDFC